MSATIHKLTLPSGLIERGFWLYVCRIKHKNEELLYVGRTGDSSWLRASSPFVRLGLHLGTREKQSLIRNHLKKKCIEAEECTSFQLVSYGPLFSETQDRSEHRRARDIVAALEKELAASLESASYTVLNEVNSKKPLDRDLWEEVRRAFARHFQELDA